VIKPWILPALIATALLLTGSPKAFGESSADPKRLLKEADECRNTLYKSKAKIKYRHHWLNCIDQYRDIASRFTDSEEAPWALYKAAQMHSKLYGYSGREVDLDDAVQKVRDKVDQAKGDLPAELPDDPVELLVRGVTLDQAGGDDGARVDHGVPGASGIGLEADGIEQIGRIKPLLGFQNLFAAIEFALVESYLSPGQIRGVVFKISDYEIPEPHQFTGGGVKGDDCSGRSRRSFKSIVYGGIRVAVVGKNGFEVEDDFLDSDRVDSRADLDSGHCSSQFIIKGEGIIGEQLHLAGEITIALVYGQGDNRGRILFHDIESLRNPDIKKSLEQIQIFDFHGIAHGRIAQHPVPRTALEILPEIVFARKEMRADFGIGEKGIPLNLDFRYFRFFGQP